MANNRRMTAAGIGVALAAGAVGLSTQMGDGLTPVEGTVAVADGAPMTAGSFSTARRWLYERVYADHRLTLYCGCDYDVDRVVDLAGCGVVARKNETRALRVEAEHAMPASRFGSHLPCWQSGGRAECLKTNAVFEGAHNDLHNLFPVVGEINGDRSNYTWARIEGEERLYGDCDFEVDFKGKTAEAAKEVQGDVARANLYMAEVWGPLLGFELTEAEAKLYRPWDKGDKPDVWELERNTRIAAIEGITNPFIDAHH